MSRCWPWAGRPSPPRSSPAGWRTAACPGSTCASSSAGRAASSCPATTARPSGRSRCPTSWRRSCCSSSSSGRTRSWPTSRTICEVQTPLDELRSTVEAAVAALGNGHRAAVPSLERPKRAGFGDYSTNAAMLLAPVLKAPPRDVAERLGDELRGRLAERLAKVEVAGPGFLNLWLGDAWFRDALGAILDAGQAYGSGGAPLGERINVEFVSANPTGPMHVGHARNAAYGDALARLLEFEGHDVTREFYANDYGP